MDQKEDHLRKRIRALGSVWVAYSGGVDSTVVAKIGVEELGEKAVIAISDTPSLPRSDFALAQKIAKDNNFNLKIVKTREFEQSEYLSNPYNRCYYCKRELYSFLKEIAQENTSILDGTHKGDLLEVREGRKAAAEFNVISPLLDSDMDKEDVRALAKRLGLENWNKPQSACLSSRLPKGVSITPERLEKIEKAEDFIKNLGVTPLRVRYHGDLVRIETSQEQVRILFEQATIIDEYLKSLGFRFTSVDLLGYPKKEKWEQPIVNH